MSLKMNSAIGERQMLPWHMNSTFIILFLSCSILVFVDFMRLSALFVLCSEITDYGKSEQN